MQDWQHLTSRWLTSSVRSSTSPSLPATTLQASPVHTCHALQQLSLHHGVVHRKACSVLQGSAGLHSPREGLLAACLPTPLPCTLRREVGHMSHTVQEVTACAAASPALDAQPHPNLQVSAPSCPCSTDCWSSGGITSRSPAQHRSLVRRRPHWWPQREWLLMTFHDHLLLPSMCHLLTQTSACRFVDPSDPSKVYLTQPSQQDARVEPPVYATNYGEDEKYEPI